MSETYPWLSGQIPSAPAAAPLGQMVNASTIQGFGVPGDYMNYGSNAGGGFNFATAGQGVGAAPPVNTGGGLGDWLKADGNLGSVFGGIQALGNTWLGLQQLGVARDNLRFQKQAYNTNLTNSTQTYNTSLEDRIRGRTADYAGKDADVSAYLQAHQLKKPGG